jgi:bifunctional UDP-N-acetylglucosamine pyrophosphorylase/glucosamine-1-phosphate N-acetyltransferase
MNHQSLHSIILAAGKSTRFKTAESKLTYEICGQAMAAYPYQACQKNGLPITLVVGHHHEAVISSIAQSIGTRPDFVIQTEQRGTGHALLVALPAVSAQTILVLNGDMPLITAEDIAHIIAEHTKHRRAISFAVAHNSDPTLQGYGRVVETAERLSIVEAREYVGDTTKDCYVNAGIYCIEAAFARTLLPTLEAVHGEIRITDLIGAAVDRKLAVGYTILPFDTVRGVNTLKELWTVEHIKRSEIISEWMEKGVRFSAAHTVHIDHDVTIGTGSFIGAGTLIIKGSTIGEQCHIEAFCFISGSTLADGAQVHSHTIMTNATIDHNAQVGPFAHIRQDTYIGPRAEVGAFVETVRTTIGANSKAKHLAYLGDATIGEHVNIGAGTITCNYDGVKKSATTIHSGAFIGSNSALIAPVEIGADAFVAAGSTITQSVPADSLALARAQQVIKHNYAPRYKKNKLSPVLLSSNESEPTAAV